MARTVLPPVPRDVPRSVSTFLTALRETVQIQSGMGRGNSLDKAVTFRDLQAGIGTTDLRRLAVNKGSGSGGGAFGDPTPPIPTGLDVYAMFTAVGLKWDRPRGDWYALTEVFRVDITDEPDATPTFSEALFVGSSTSGYYSDTVNSSSTYVYWVRHLNRDYQAGPVSSPYGTKVTTRDTPAQVLEEYSTDLFNGENVEWLRSELSAIDALNRALEGNGFGDSSLSKLLGESSSVSDLLAEQALSEALSKHTQAETIQSQFAKNYARLSGGIHAAVNADEAYVMRIQELESRWENDLGVFVDSKINDFETVFSSPQGGLAQAIKDFRVDFNGSSSSLQELASTTASLDEGYKAQWGVKTTVDGLKGGVGFLNDGVETSFVVDAQTFAVTGGNDKIAPFIIKDGKTVMDTAVIDSADIYSLVAANITAERVKIGVSLDSPKIDGGEITGGTLAIGSGFSVTNDGIMKSIDGYFGGEIKAESGEMRNVLIHESCEVRGTLSALNIEGDVVDRTVVAYPDRVGLDVDGQVTIMSGNIVKGALGASFTRNLVVSGFIFQTNTHPYLRTAYEVVLYLDGVEQHVYFVNGEEYGINSVQLGCEIPKGSATRSFEIVARAAGSFRMVLVPSSVTVDVFKNGSTLTGVSRFPNQNL